MARLEDLSGREFGFLRVISRAPDKITPSGQKCRMWNCKCRLCGNEKAVPAINLKRGTAKSCGCWQGIRGKASRNLKTCIICGKQFESPPSDKTVTCSDQCRRIRAEKSAAGREKSAEYQAQESRFEITTVKTQNTEWISDDDRIKKLLKTDGTIIEDLIDEEGI